jgi:hypothetical protein
MIPLLAVRFRGVPVSLPPRPTNTPIQPALTLRLNGVVRNVIPRPGFGLEETSDLESETVEPTGTNDSDAEDSDVDRVLDEALGKDADTEQDSEDGPDWLFEEGEKTSADPLYVFCPAPHRKQVLHLFTRHFCRHPISSQPKTAPNPLQTFAVKLCMKCTPSATFAVFGRFGATFGHPGTRRTCGSFGHDQPRRFSHAYEPP